MGNNVHKHLHWYFYSDGTKQQEHKDNLLGKPGVGSSLGAGAEARLANLSPVAPPSE